MTSVAEQPREYAFTIKPSAMTYRATERIRKLAEPINR